MDTKANMKIRTTTTLASIALLCGLCFFPPACAQSLDARCSEGACDPRDGSANDGPSDAPTDPCIDNPSDPKCLDETTALFVSATGDDKDALAGTKSKPLRTIGAAVLKIDATK